ncbi:MAG: rhombosortase [Planctomycetes bacterium]|nr:rhombosortase [Planctomycetota bacterium]
MRLPLLPSLRPAGRRIPCASPLLTLLAVAIHLCPAAPPLLEFRREAVAEHEIWRVVTCHWTHFSWDHLLWDALALVVLGSLWEMRSGFRFWLGLALSALLIPAGIAVGLPDIQSYRGLSGIDSALFAGLACEVLAEKWRERRRLDAAAVAALGLAFAGKVLFEMLTGQTLFVDSAAAGMTPLPLAHLLGAAAGVLAVFVVERPGNAGEKVPNFSGKSSLPQRRISWLPDSLSRWS